MDQKNNDVSNAGAGEFASGRFHDRTGFRAAGFVRPRPEVVR